jgi:hypothetical protein
VDDRTDIETHIAERRSDAEFAARLERMMVEEHAVLERLQGTGDVEDLPSDD